MAFSETDELEPGAEEAGPPPEESSNRTFLIVAGILGGILLISLLCFAAYMLFRYPRNKEKIEDQNATAIAQATGTALSESLKRTQEAALKPPTRTPVPPTNTAAPTSTPVVAGLATQTSSPTLDPLTATVGALLTQAASSQLTSTAAAAQKTQQLPTSGFADEVGLPIMIGLAVVLVVVIFLARRLRTAG